MPEISIQIGLEYVLAHVTGRVHCTAAEIPNRTGRAAYDDRLAQRANLFGNEPSCFPLKSGFAGSPDAQQQYDHGYDGDRSTSFATQCPRARKRRHGKYVYRRRGAYGAAWPGIRSGDWTQQPGAATNIATTSTNLSPLQKNPMPPTNAPQFQKNTKGYRE